MPASSTIIISFRCKHYGESKTGSALLHEELGGDELHCRCGHSAPRSGSSTAGTQVHPQSRQSCLEGDPDVHGPQAGQDGLHHTGGG